MYAVNGTTIVLTRGDTFICDVEIKKEVGNTTEDYVPQEGDSIRFALKRKVFTADNGNYVDSHPLIHKDIPINTMTLEIEPDDTKGLKFGTYAYDIQLTTAEGKVDTFLSGDFNIVPEVE